jgi:phosphodiester glycosidase
MRVVVLDPREPLSAWCARNDVPDALVGGFFVSATGVPLGELWIGGGRVPTHPFAQPWAAARSCLVIQEDLIGIVAGGRLPPAIRGDVLQAGPRLVAGGRATVDPALDPEGFSAGSAQFDSDITVGRHPRAALGLTPDRLLAVACDGRAGNEAGLTLTELAELLVALGARAAINLDGGGSTALVSAGRLRNRPRAAMEEEIPGGRAISTALVFAPKDAQAGATRS